MHLAAMGPEVAEEESASGRIRQLVLRPFGTSQAGVVTGTASPPPARPATAVRGWVLDDACRAYEFRVESVDASQERVRLEARVVQVHEGRPFVGFNRARHAVVEGAILVTRLHLLGADEVARRLRELAPLVEKTGGKSEREAFELLEARVAAG